MCYCLESIDLCRKIVAKSKMERKKGSLAKNSFFIILFQAVQILVTLKKARTDNSPTSAIYDGGFFHICGNEISELLTRQRKQKQPQNW